MNIGRAYGDMRPNEDTSSGIFLPDAMHRVQLIRSLMALDTRELRAFCRQTHESRYDAFSTSLWTNPKYAD
jgi:hypothetical protein